MEREGISFYALYRPKFLSENSVSASRQSSGAEMQTGRSSARRLPFTVVYPDYRLRSFRFTVVVFLRALALCCSATVQNIHERFHFSVDGHITRGEVREETYHQVSLKCQ